MIMFAVKYLAGAFFLILFGAMALLRAANEG